MVASPLRWVGPVAATLAAVLVVSSFRSGVTPGPTVVTAKEDERSALYSLAGPQADTLAMLDPATLETISGARMIRLGAARDRTERRLLASQDGSALAVVSIHDRMNAPPGTADISIRLYDVAQHVKRPAYHPAVAIDPWSMGMSPDGRQVFGQRIGSDGMSLGWYVLNAATGKVQKKVSFVRSCCGQALYDSARQRLYLLDDATTDGSGALSVYDVGKRVFVDRLSLPNVSTGAMQTDRMVNGNPVIAMWEPGLALSPDGSQIAIVAANTGTVHLVDTQRLTLTRSETLHASSSLPGRLGSLLGVVPAVAWAKEMEGVMLNAAYSPDGRQLYVTGMQGRLESNNTFAWHGLGLRVVDLSDGHIAAQSLGGEGIGWIQPTPGGSALYTLSAHQSSPEGESCPCVLRRLDPTSLAPVSQRTFAIQPAVGLADRWGG